MKTPKTKILIVGANGAMGGFTLLKLYGNDNLSVLILPSEVETFMHDKLMQEDQWFPTDKTFIPKSALVLNQEPKTQKEVGVFTAEKLNSQFFTDNSIVFITSKIFHYDHILSTLKPFIHKNTVLCALANGLKPEITLEQKCQEQGITNPIVRAVIMGGTHFTFDQSSQCLGVHSGIAKFVIGKWGQEYDPQYDHILKSIASLFSTQTFAINPQFGDDFRLLSFDKILANLVNPISAITGCSTIEYVIHDLLKEIITNCFDEGIKVGLAIGLALNNRDAIVNSKLEMYEKAGKSAKAHLPSMGQDALRALLNRTPLLHENDHIGMAIVQEGLNAKNKYQAKLIAGFNLLLQSVTEIYSTIYNDNKDNAARFLLHLMMLNRYSLGLQPTNHTLYSQFQGLQELEKRINPNFTNIKKISKVEEVTAVFEENLNQLKKK